MKKIRLVFIFCTFILLQLSILNAQETFPQNGVYDQREGLYAFTNATIYKTYNDKIEQGTLVIRDGKVEAIGSKIAIPENAVIIDLEGKFIYPSFIDLYTDYGLPKEKPAARGNSRRGNPQDISNKKGAYSWNQAVKPEWAASEHFAPDSKTAKEFIKQGFGLVLSHKKDGISRGSSTLVSLGEGRAHELILSNKGAHHLSFNKGTSTQSYPSSLMGSIALIRQTYLDGEWYKQQNKESNLSLKAWNEIQELPQIFETRDHLEALRVDKIASEFGTKFIIKGSGTEYRRIEAIKATGQPFILPLNFPDAFDVEDPYDALIVSLTQLKHWELAPENPGRVANAGISIALTTDGLSKKGAFLKMLRKAVESGLSKEQALKALTQTPATMLNVYDKTGSLERTKIANFFITDGDIFASKTTIFHNWINGKPHVFKNLSKSVTAGNYSLKVDGNTYDLSVSEEGEMEISINDTTSVKIKSSTNNDMVTLAFNLPDQKNKMRLSGVIENNKWHGRGQNMDGNWLDWEANFTSVPEPKKERKKGKGKPTSSEAGSVIYPFIAHGWEKSPKPSTVLIKNATVWTNESAGILKNTDVLVQNGKIAAVGKNLKSKNAQSIDGTGKHITAGIIDEHTHIAITRGGNEGTQASSAEVRIGDIINSEDINIYRQLAGGVTTAQVLHGSANPIGGQSGIIKLRWGYEPEKMKFEGADGFIKFALGENVKQSNWGDNFTSRFPQTRMGVEQVFNDHFTRAREYGVKKASGKPYRKDLDLEALLEILNSKRFITCHSYRQSEINMLMKVADNFGFTVNTFTHILEGYKVAGQMKKHGAAGSTFSDWWAYKHEVLEAIPYNAAIMHEQGVVVSINSDDAEMGRRLNQEAGKTVLYGNVPEEEALKFVTLNPAKMLHIDDRVGSIKVGKDADLVIWSDHPLSVYAKAEKTFVDGIKFFDREEDMEKRKEIAKERNRIIQKMLNEKQSGKKTRPVYGKQEHKLYHCDDLGE
jgi:imidazolonepropionase-like amidohydrolase